MSSVTPHAGDHALTPDLSPRINRIRQPPCIVAVAPDRKNFLTQPVSNIYPREHFSIFVLVMIQVAATSVGNSCLANEKSTALGSEIQLTSRPESQSISPDTFPERQGMCGTLHSPRARRLFLNNIFQNHQGRRQGQCRFPGT